MSGSGLIRGFQLVVVLACAWATTGCSAGPQVPQHHRLDMRGLAFHPRDLQVVPGDTITWVNRDIVSHTVTASDSRWDSGEVPPAGRFSVVAEGTDTIRYECRYHPAMVGSLLAR